MADAIVRLRVESSEYDQKLSRATQQLQHMEKEVRRTGATFAYADKEEIAFIQSLGSMETKTTSAKSQLREYTEALMQMTSTYRNLTQEEKNSDWGKALAASMDEIKGKAAMMRDAMADVNREIGGMASDTMVFDQIAGGMTGLITVFQVGQGAMQMFGVKSEEAMQAMAKLQGAMAVTNGLSKLQNLLQKESALMIGVSTLQRKAATAALNLETAAQGKNIVAAKAATAAQKVLNAVANANPYVLLASAVLGVAAALYGFSKASGRAKDAAEKEVSAADRQKEAYEKIGKSVGEVMGKYNRLKTEWENLSSEQEKKTWLEENKNLFEQLGLNINSVVDADNAFVTSTDKVVAALKARAKANALQGLYEEKVKEVYEKAANTEDKMARQEAGRSVGWGTKEWKAFQESGISTEGMFRTETKVNPFTEDLQKFEVFTEEGAKVFNQFLDDLHKKSIEEATKIGMETVEELYGSMYTASINEANAAEAATKGLVGGTTTATKTKEKVQKALEDYATAMNIAAIRKEAGLDDEEKYKEKELAAHERLFDAYTDAYNTYADPKYKAAFDKEAEEVLALAQAVKELKDAKEKQKQADKELEQAEKDKARQIKQLDTSILSGLTSTAKKAGWTSKELGTEGIKTKINAGIDITDEEWTALQDKLNERLQSLGMDPIRIDFETGNIEEVVDKTQQKFEEMMSTMQSGVSAISTIGNAFNDLKSIGEDLSEAFSGNMDTWDALMTVFNSGIGIMQTVMGVMEAINTLQELSGALSKKKVVEQTAETATVVAGKGAEAAAETAEASASGAATVANTAEAASGAGKAMAGIPIVGPVLAVAAIAAVLAAVLSATSKAKSAGNFSTGGIVPGNSYSGDNLNIGVNSQELVLNRAQTSNLASQLNSNPMSNMRLSTEISGSNLRVVLNNDNRQRGGSRDVYGVH